MGVAFEGATADKDERLDKDGTEARISPDDKGIEAFEVEGLVVVDVAKDVFIIIPNGACGVVHLSF